jgi:hypothetical protein
VDDEASNLWRRGQNIQGAMPKNILGTARMVSSALKWVYFAKRVLWTMKRAIFGAAVKIFKAQCRRIFWAPQEWYPPH